MFLVMWLRGLAGRAIVEADQDRIVLIRLLVREGKHDRFGNELKRRLAAARRIGGDLVKLRELRLLIAVAANHDAQLRGIGAGRSGRPDQQVTGDANLDAELATLNVAFARGIGDIELIEYRII